MLGQLECTIVRGTILEGALGAEHGPSFKAIDTRWTFSVGGR